MTTFRIIVGHEKEWISRKHRHMSSWEKSKWKTIRTSNHGTSTNRSINQNLQTLTLLGMGVWSEGSKDHTDAQSPRKTRWSGDLDVIMVSSIPRITSCYDRTTAFKTGDLGKRTIRNIILSASSLYSSQHLLSLMCENFAFPQAQVPHAFLLLYFTHTHMEPITPMIHAPYALWPIKTRSDRWRDQDVARDLVNIPSKQ
jgi:hypothetical protein